MSELGVKIRRRREELFGPKPGTPGRQTVDVDGPIFAADPTPGAASKPDGRLDPVDGGEVTSVVQAKYEMELGAHRDTTVELVAAKDALIAYLEQRVRDRDETIAQLQALLIEQRSTS